MAMLLDLTDTAVPKGRVKVPPRPAPGPREPISVNGVVIGEDMVRTEAQNHPAGSPAEAFEAAARALVVRELLLQTARARGLAAAPEPLGEGRRETDEDALIRALLDLEIHTPTADEATCRRYYDAHPERFRSETLFEARHILLAAPEHDEEARTRTKDLAARLIAELTAAPERFADLALAHSACPSRAQGGHLGQLSRGATVPEFETVLFALEPGALAPEPVATRFGHHVVRLERRIAGERLPFEVVAPRIAGWLEAASWSRAVAQYIGIQAGRARITGIALAVPDGPPAQ